MLNGEGMAPEAKYQEISREIREKILKGIWPPDSRIPTRSELIRHYGTTIATMQKAMNELLNDGFLVALGKSGTFVAGRPPNIFTYAVIFPVTPAGQAQVLADSLWSLVEQRKRQLEEEGNIRLNFYYLELDNQKCPEFLRLVADAAAGRIAGAIFPYPPLDYMLAPLRENAIPAVVITRDRLPGVNTVWVDFGGFFRTAFDLLKERGCRRIAVITNVRMPYDYLEMLAEYAEERGMKLPPEWRLGVSLEFHPVELGGNLVRLLFSRSAAVRPDGLVVGNENLRDIVFSALQSLQLRPGRDVHIVQHANLPAPPGAMPVKRVGFEIGALLRACVGELRRTRQDGIVKHDRLVPAIIEE